MFLNAQQNLYKTAIKVAIVICRVDYKKIITILLMLLPLQTKVAFTAENAGDTYPLEKTGTIQRNVVDNVEDKAEDKVEDKTDARAINFTAAIYELTEVRDEINDLIEHPNPIAEEIIVEDIPALKVPAVTNLPKEKVIITKKSKPIHKIAKVKTATKKPVPVKKLQLVPIQDNQTEAIKSATITVKTSKPVYLKYDKAGNLLDQKTEQWSCVHDSNSGLIWEVKSSDDSMRNANNLYSWLATNQNESNGFADGGRCQGDAACDTNAYIQAMNKQNFCGYNDWQLPTREQLQTLVYLKNKNQAVKINKKYFPETVPSWYWTASEHNNNTDFAWYVLFRNGVSLNDLKERPKHIRLVRQHSSQVAAYK